MDAPQRLVEEEPSIEGLLEENTLLKEEFQVLRKEVETWKETCRKQGEKKMYTLVEAAEQLEESNSAEPGKEDEHVICPTYGEIFKKRGHEIIFSTVQQPMSTMEEPTEKEDAVTQEPASLTILAEAATNPVTEEKKDEFRNDDGDKDCTMNSECSHDVDMIEAEPQGQDINKLEQGAATQEPTTLNILVQLAEKVGEEFGMENTLDLEYPHDTGLREELQPQEDEEVIQDVVTQEPTSLGIAAGIPEFQLEDNPGMDIMPDTQWSEDEKIISLR